MSAGAGPRPRTQIAIAIVEEQGRFLVGLREPGTALAGYWEFPGGKVQSGEPVEAAAIRECLEETGLRVQVTGEYPGTCYDYEHADVELHFFACAVTGRRSELPPRFRWVPRLELARYQFPPANAALLERLMKT
jgi:8-oxo-dGTP diphosphatase